MNWMVFHLVSGDAFFTGVVLLVTGALASLWPGSILNRSVVLASLLGLIAVILSTTALPYWTYAVAGVVTLAWLSSSYVRKWRRWTAIACAAVWLMAALVELPYHITPTLSPVLERSITVVGDSVTAGVDADETSVTWPRVLARQRGVEVQDISRMGETAASALKAVRSHVVRSPIVIVEIGGNDLLGPTSAADFARDLDALLRNLTAPDRQIVMFELPLPPFCHEYGRAQRLIANKYKVKLIPRRIFLSVIADSAATLDSIHLSPAGHQHMADTVWRLLQSAYSK